MLVKTNNKSHIAEQIFQKLLKLEPNLKRQGMIAGQAVASAYQELTQSNFKGQYNDIDVFYFYSESSQIIQNLYYESKRSKSKEINEIILGGESLGRHSYDRIFYINRDKGSYKIHKTSRNGLINSVVGSVPDRVRFVDNPTIMLELLVSGFDLNCVMIGICFDESGNVILHKNKMYSEFLKSGQILLTNFYSFAHSVARGAKKSEQISNTFFDKKSHINALRDESILNLVARNQLIDEYTLNRFKDFYQENLVYSHLKEILDENDYGYSGVNSPEYLNGRNSIMIALQRGFGISYGLKYADIAFGLEMKERGIFNYEFKDRLMLSTKKMETMYRFFHKHFLGMMFSANTNSIRTAYLFKNNESVIGQIESIYKALNQMHKSKLASRIEEAMNSVNKDEVLTCISELEDEIKLAREGFIKAQERVKKYTPKKVFGYQVKFYDDKNDLIKLGEEENHCVGGYHALTLAGRSIIFTISKKGEPRTTVELGLRYGHYKVVQQYEKGNSSDFSKNQRVVAHAVAFIANLFHKKTARQLKSMYLGWYLAKKYGIKDAIEYGVLRLLKSKYRDLKWKWEWEWKRKTEKWRKSSGAEAEQFNAVPVENAFSDRDIPF